MTFSIPEVLCRSRQGFIRSWLYKLFLKYSIRHAVDIALINPKDPGKIILCLRTKKPALGEWWFFGGVVKLLEIQELGTRIQKVALEPTVRRIAKKEFGCEIKIVGVSPQYVTTFEDGPFGLPITYTHCLFIVTASEGSTIELDSTSSGVKSFSLQELKQGSGLIHSSIASVLRIAHDELTRAGLC